MPKKTNPATASQLAAALTALGAYDDENRTRHNKRSVHETENKARQDFPTY